MKLRMRRGEISLVIDCLSQTRGQIKQLRCFPFEVLGNITKQFDDENLELVVILVHHTYVQNCSKHCLISTSYLVTGLSDFCDWLDE